MGLQDLFGSKQETISAEEFWRRTAEKRGAEILFNTFAVYMGRAKENLHDLAGLLYLAGDTLWFEDFEKDGGLMGLFIRKSAYVKTEFSVPKADIVSVKPIQKKDALSCIRGVLQPAAVTAMSRFNGFFARPVIQIALSSGGAVYFEAMKEKELMQVLGGAASGT